MINDELLGELRRVIGVDDLAFAEAPEKLSGGFFTTNFRFRLVGASSPWDGPLVVRLFPPVIADDSVVQEAVVQRGLAAAGLPTPAVLHFDLAARVDGRRYFVMEFLSGGPLLAGIGVGPIIRNGPRILRGLSQMTADVQARLHAIDPAPIVAQLDAPATVDRFFGHLQRLIDRGADGFADGLRWLVDHRPTEREALVICHGDVHPGNLLVDKNGNLTAILDWTVATLAEPAFEVGFTTMALSLTPIDAPRTVQRLAMRFGRGIARRYVNAYTALRPADVSAQPYYEALRCAVEVGNAASWRLAMAAGRTDEQPRPTWDSIADTMVRYFHARTGVELVLPPPVPV